MKDMQLSTFLGNCQRYQETDNLSSKMTDNNIRK